LTWVPSLRDARAIRGFLAVAAFAVIVTVLAQGYQAVNGDDEPAPAEARPTGRVLRQDDDKRDDVSLRDGTTASRPEMDVTRLVVAHVDRASLTAVKPCERDTSPVAQ
jgi:hypothetical protein